MAFTPFSRLAGALAVLWIAVALIPVTAAFAAAPGSIEGRVLSPAYGTYLERARITLAGTSHETFTDPDGYYRLDGIPAGSVTLKVFYTGMAPLVETVVVTAGQALRRDVSLVAVDGKASPGGDVVKLGAFVVSTSKEMAGAAIAINEQRFASTIMNVISSDEFGGVAEGNTAEVLKFLPGVTVDTGSTINNRYISINGVSSENVPVTIDGFSLASGGTGTTRAVQVDLISINNLARIEVTYSPTPDSKGAALAGSVNMVPRSAFERSRPVFSGSVYMTMRDDAHSFHKVLSAEREPTTHVHPGFDFSYVAPVNKRFGYTLSGGHSTQFARLDRANLIWRGGNSDTNGAAFPDTTPDRPYLSSYSTVAGLSNTRRGSAGATMDYRITPQDRLSLSVQWSSFEVTFKNNTLAFNPTRVLPGFGPSSTPGVAGAGDIQLTHEERIRINRTIMPTLIWRHDGPVWKSVTGGGMSRAQDQNFGPDKGFFRSTVARRTNVTVSFDGNHIDRPGVVSVRDGTSGAVVDPHVLTSYVLASGSNAQTNSIDLQRSVYSNLRRDFPGRWPVTLKGGIDVSQSVRDLRGGTPAFTFVGRDGRASTTPAGSDDSPAPFTDQYNPTYSPAYGFPATGMVSNRQISEHHRANPNEFQFDANAAYRSAVTASKFAAEIISAAFLRGDLSLLDRRLKLVGGIRAEQTNLKGEGPLTDPTRNFQRSASGALILGAGGRPLPIAPATDTLGVSKLTFLERASRSEKEYLRLFPSLNAGYNLRENLVARAAHYYSIGRPDLVQYVNGITLPDTSLPPAQGNRITVANAGIKPWKARTTNLRLEYYFGGVGQISFGAFRRDFENAFGGGLLRATPEFLALYGLDEASYGGYDVSTQVNVDGVVRMTGVDFNYKQVLTFLPHWARGLQVFANGSAQRAKGPSLGSFAGSGYVPRSGSWGVSLTRDRYNVRANWNYRGRNRQDLVAAGRSIQPDTYNWGRARLYTDVLGECHIRKNLSLFANLRNIGAVDQNLEIYGPSTPPVARLRSRLDSGSLWTFGLKGTF
jgi:iron complex outermembrane receptor protein